MAGSRDHRPTWQLLLDAGRGLTARGTTEFTRAELIAAVQLMDPDRDPSSIGPILQGMTANAPGGPRSACGEVFRRVDRGVYTLVSPGGARARRSTRAGGAAGPAVSTWPARPGSAAADVPGGRVSGPTRVERSWGPLPGPRAGPSSKRSRIEARLEMLVAGFDGYVADYDRRVPFTRSGQYELHRATIDRRRAHGTLAHALADDRFVRLLHDTLRAWGIGKRGSRLVPVPELAAALRAHSAPLVALDGLELEKLGATAEPVGTEVWELIRTLPIVANVSRVVPGTKTLHHLLPDLVPPMDRAYTGRFFEWTDLQVRQRQAFLGAWQDLARVAARTCPSRLVGRGWRTSAAKVVDNAVVAFGMR